MKITRAHQNAGIISVLCQNYNGSYTCEVDLRKVDLLNSKANPRRHSKKHGDKISKNWFQKCVRNPIFRYDMGILTSIDGRHTSRELIRRGIFKVTAEVHFNIDGGDAARIFHDLTVNSKRIDSWDAHVCALEAGLAHAIDIQNALDDYGLQGQTEGRKKHECDVASYSPLLEAWEASGDRLNKLCFLISEVYNDENTGCTTELANDCEFMRGLIDLCGHSDYISWNAASIGDRLRVFSIFKIKNRAGMMAAGKARRLTRRHWLPVLLEVMRFSRRVA